MKFSNFYLAAALIGVLFTAACSNNSSSTSDPEADLSTKLDSVSYAFGLQNGKFLAQQGLSEIDIQNFAAGLNEGIQEKADSLNLFSDMQANQIIQGYMMSMTEEASSANKEEGTAFLEENLTKEGVQETPSGLQYKVIEEGNGASPEATDQVRVHYVGQLIDGTIFDTSRKEVAQENGLYNQQREPYNGSTFPLNRVIPGWTEGLQLMQEGAVYEFYIPSDLAYGDNAPQGSPIQPGSTLIFEVELLEVLDSE